MREAVSFVLPQASVIDEARVELYQRINDVNLFGSIIPSASGYAVQIDKKLPNRSDLALGYASVDNHYGVYSGSLYLEVVGFAWNGDSYETGNRAFAKVKVKLATGVTAVGFYTHIVTDAPVPLNNSNRQGYSGGINFDLKALADSRKSIF